MLNAQQERLKSSRSDLQALLESTGAKFKGKMCKCPFHDDKSPSAGVYEKDGHWAFKCHGCGVAHDIFSLRAHLNKSTVGDELRKVGENEWLKSNEKPPEVFNAIEQIAARFGNVEETYRYTHPASGIVELAVIRWRDERGKKHFIQVTPTPGGYWMKGVALENPIYNRNRVNQSERVVVVEGEKCVHSLHELGIVATTSPGGALKGNLADWRSLAGRTAVLWPDADEPEEAFPRGKGHEHMKQIQKILQGLVPPAKIFWMNPAQYELSEGGDVADLIERYRKEFNKTETAALIEDALADAEPMGIIGEYAKELDAIIAGMRRVIPMPWNRLSNYSRALMPSKVTCVCGDGGAGKSLFMSQCLVDWQQSTGTRACIYHLEDDRNYHMLRVHAQLAGDSRITDHGFIEANGQWMKQSLLRWANDLSDIGARIFEAPDDQVSLAMLGVWVEQRARDNFEVIIIDPITAAESDSRPWIADLKFITKCKVIARRYGCRIVLVTHPRTGSKMGKSTHNDMAGGAAYPRFAHTVLWIERNDLEAEYIVDDDTICQPMTPNRLVNISKARNGPGAGRKIAFDFDNKTLRYQEIGMVKRQPT